MANEEHLALLKKGVKAFNQWRKENPDEHLDLRTANLSGVDFRGADLSRVNLGGAKLIVADLSGVDLSGAELIRAILTGANLEGAKLIKADLGGVNLSGANLSEASLIDADLTNAVLTSARLWETQRGGWSIKGVKCESVFWDREGGEAIHYAAGEFERLYAEKTKIVLHYEGGISPLEIATLPSLIQQLEKEHKHCSFRLDSIKEGPGGATVSLVVEGENKGDVNALGQHAQQIQSLRRKLLDETDLRKEVEHKLNYASGLLEKAMSKSNNIFNGPVNAAHIGDTTISDSGTQAFNQTFNTQDNLDDIKELISHIQAQRQELTDQLTPEKSKALDEAVCDVETQLGSEAPDDSIVSKALTSVKTILEGASGSVLASGVLVMLGRLV